MIDGQQVNSGQGGDVLRFKHEVAIVFFFLYTTKIMKKNHQAKKWCMLCTANIAHLSIIVVGIQRVVVRDICKVM